MSGPEKHTETVMQSDSISELEECFPLSLLLLTVVFFLINPSPSDPFLSFCTRTKVIHSDAPAVPKPCVPHVNELTGFN